MNKKIKLVFIICLALGIALGALNLFAMSQKHHLVEIEEQQAARKKALGQIAAADVLGRAFERLRSWQLSDVLEGIVRESGWIARLEAEGPQGIAKAANVLAAIRFASELADQSVLGASRAASEFSRWIGIARQGLASLDTGAAGVVRVMTVHASKGLEFPVCAVAELWGTSHGGEAIVSENIGTDILCTLIPKDAAKFVPEQDEMPSSDDAPIEEWASFLSSLHKRSEQAERGRLLYVALTRAKEALILCASVKVTKDVNANGTHWGPLLVSDACSALFGSDLPETGISHIEYGGTSAALVRHVRVAKTETDEAGATCIPLDSAGSFEPIDLPVVESSTVELFESAVSDGIAEKRLDAVPFSERTGVFSYSSVHAKLLDAHAADAAGGAGQDDGAASGEVFRRAQVAIAEDEDDLQAPMVGDDDKATNLGSAFHQLAQTMVESGGVPTKERIDASARTWQLSRPQRARLAAALERWARSSLRAEALGHGILRAEVPFFIAVDSEYGTHLEGAIDLLCTDPGSTHALVIDYKTGDSGLTLEQIRARHAMQASFYASVLMRLGYSSVECAFVCVELDDGEGGPVTVRYSFDAERPPTFDVA